MKKTKTTQRKGFDIPGMKHMRCPYCGSAVHLRSADGIYTNNSGNAKLYVCTKYPVCDSYVRAHSGTMTPVGSLANAKLRSVRTTAHKHFDKLHETGLMTRKEAYAWLAFIIQSPMSHAHIGYQSEYYCNIIIEESDKYFESMKWKLNPKTRHEPGVAGGEHHAAQ